MKKRKKGNHGIYELTCISDKCSRRFKVLYDVRTVSRAEQIEKLPPQANTYNVWGYVQVTYPFNGCPFCGTWWCTGPLDGEAYPKRKLDPVFPVPADYMLANEPLFATGQQQASAFCGVLLGAIGMFGRGALGGGFGGTREPYK